MQPQMIAWVAAALLAVVTLTQLMRARQQQLKDLLQAYVKAQREWSQKRAKAARLAQKMASAKVGEEAQPPLQAGATDSPEATRPQKAA